MPSTATAYRDAFCARIRELRDRKEWTQEQMATALHIPLERYTKYERRTLMPHPIIEQFAQICEVEIAYIMTGRAGPPPPKRTGMARTSRP